MAIDYGRKRVGIAVTDPLQIIANSLNTVSTNEIWTFLEDYMKNETVDRFIVGYPRNMDGTLSESMEYIKPFVKKLKKTYPDVPVEYYDERFTSKIAVRSMVEGGLKKQARRNKAMVDKISANLILQDYLEFKKHQTS
jgi:putative Holliday junction resolvase